MASPSQIHQTILTELLVSIRNYLRKKGSECQVFPAPFDVKLSDGPLTIVQPDLMVVCDKNKLDGKRCNGAPDFIIEIVSPSNPSDDYIRKLYYYKNAGVREYWIVDPRTEKVIVYTHFRIYSRSIFTRIYISIFGNWIYSPASRLHRSVAKNKGMCSTAYAFFDNILPCQSTINNHSKVIRLSGELSKMHSY